MSAPFLRAFGWFAPPKSTRAGEPTLFMESFHSKPALLALWDIAVFEWWNAPLPFFLLYLANDLPPVIGGQQCFHGRSQRGTDRSTDLSSAGLYEPMKKDKTTESDQGCGKSIHRGYLFYPSNKPYRVN